MQVSLRVDIAISGIPLIGSLLKRQVFLRPCSSVPIGFSVLERISF
jgi:hypothetical protein